MYVCIYVHLHVHITIMFMLMFIACIINCMCLDCLKVMEKKQGLIKPSLTEGEQDSVADDVTTNANTSVVPTKRGNCLCLCTHTYVCTRN